MIQTDPKILTISQIADQVSQCKKKGKKVVLCHGEFDLLHPGHLRYFKGAKKEGDVLVVSLTPDRFINRGPGRPVFAEAIRAESIAALEIVDYVGINEWPTAVETLKTIKPDIYCKGAEYLDRGKDVTGRITIEEKTILELGGRMHFVEDVTFSSSNLLNRFFNVYPPEVAEFIRKNSTELAIERLISCINSIRNLKILIIGDTIIDEYYYCEVLGKSPKSINLTARFLSSEKFTGGVLASANHIAEFCTSVQLVTGVGELYPEIDFIIPHLNPAIQRKIFTKAGASTILKRRFVEQGFLTKMFEVCYLNDSGFDENLNREICSFLHDETSRYDLIIINDFGHGFISPAMQEVLAHSSATLAVNAQTNSANFGFNLISKYKRADYVCIDEPELRLATHDKKGDLKDLIRQVYDRMKCRTVAITRGHKGAMVYSAKGFAEVPVLSTKIVDTVGAGDAFFALTAPLEHLGCSPAEIGFIGNAVGALAVQIVCNREPINYQQLTKFITAMLK